MSSSIFRSVSCLSLSFAWFYFPFFSFFHLLSSLPPVSVFFFASLRSCSCGCRSLPLCLLSCSLSFSIAFSFSFGRFRCLLGFPVLAWSLYCAFHTFSFCVPNCLPSFCLSHCGLLPCCHFLVFSPLWPLLAVSAPLSTLPHSLLACSDFLRRPVLSYWVLASPFSFLFFSFLSTFLLVFPIPFASVFLPIFSFCFTDLSVGAGGSLLFFSFGLLALVLELLCLPCVSLVRSLSRTLLHGLRCSSSLGGFLGCLFLLSFPFFFFFFSPAVRRPF